MQTANIRLDFPAIGHNWAELPWRLCVASLAVCEVIYKGISMKFKTLEALQILYVSLFTFLFCAITKMYLKSLGIALILAKTCWLLLSCYFSRLATSTF